MQWFTGGNIKIRPYHRKPKWQQIGRTLDSSSQARGFKSSRHCWDWEIENRGKSRLSFKMSNFCRRKPPQDCPRETTLFLYFAFSSKNREIFFSSSCLSDFLEWKGSNHKQSTRWQHVSWLKS